MTVLSPAVALTRRLIALDTRDPEGNEAECIALLGRILEEAGFRVTTTAFADHRPSIVAHLGPGRRPALGFAGHADTVPLGTASWHHDPFGGRVLDSRVYGRGASDMKSGLAAMVTAACRLAPRLAGTGEDLIVIIVSGEETGCRGSRQLATQPAILGRAGGLIVAEPTGNYPLVGHKGALWLSAAFCGRTAHGSMPEQGDNAVYKAAAAVERLRGFDFAVAPHPVLGRPTYNVGYIHGGLNINSVPDSAEIGIDIRTLPDMDHKALAGRIGRWIGPDATLGTLLDVEAIWTDPDLPWIQAVYDATAPFLDSMPEPRAAPYFTDGAPLRAAYGGVPTLILGPGEPAMAHRTDESCPVANIDAATAIYQRIGENWYGLPPAAAG